jgi:ATP adenylyltransferase
MERLWSPWRMAYIESAKGEPEGGCIFCDKPLQEDERAALVLDRNERAFALLNAYPYNPGHLMVAPLRHVAEFDELDPGELAAVDALLQRSIRALKAEMDPHGFNVGMNLGRVAGAGIPGHLHWHLVPRWNGDTNFMPVVGETRVLPQLLEETYDRLRPRFDRPLRAGS